jgi:DNA-binding NarL/FixJ family response regulator
MNYSHTTNSSERFPSSMTPPSNHDNAFPIDDWLWKRLIKQLGLPPQQARLVRLILMRYQDSEIAQEMNLAGSTVRTYITRIFQNTGTRDRIDLVITLFTMALETQRQTIETMQIDALDSNALADPKT